MLTGLLLLINPANNPPDFSPEAEESAEEEQPASASTALSNATIGIDLQVLFLTVHLRRGLNRKRAAKA
jgi:hypothetical protein